MSVPPPDDTPPFRYTAALADQIELRWQAHWDERATFRQPNPGQPGFDAVRPKFYCLDMFPYPSGAGLHVGHPEGYTATDIVCRFMRMKGRNVLHPMGWDAFGLPAEQYAIQTGIHPAATTRASIDTFRRQLKRFGFSYDWSREFATIDPAYYQWTQWIFLRCYDSWFDPEAENATGGRGRARRIADLIQELEGGDLRVGPDGALVRIAHAAASLEGLAGEPVGLRHWHELDAAERRAILDDQRLAYLDESVVNWCPALGTVLANDEVIDGRSERGGHPVVRKPLKQWMFRITAYAERLLADLRLVDWPDSTRAMQTEWIGRSEGAEIDFDVELNSEISNLKSKIPTPLDPLTLRVFTTRPDTLFGATYMVVAPEHPLIEAALAAADNPPLRAYVAATRSRSEVDRMAEGATKAKTGVPTGLHAINPATGRPIPIWTADYVLMGYGTGAIMAVPAHDERDAEFARAFGLPIVEVVRPAAGVPSKACFTGDGVAINSAGPELTIDGLATAEAKAAVVAWLDRTGRGRSRINYRLRDWAFSRQRYWGEPFPIVYDAAGDHYPVSDAALPVVLPDLADYSPIESDEPRPLLAKATDWVNTTAGAAGVSPDLLPPSTPVRRETNTMPGSAGSSWYVLRYCDPTNTERPAGREAESYWMGGPASPGADLYIGGSEHAVGHLLYSRFWQKVLFDLGEVSAPEPFHRLFHQGMITSYAYQRADKSIVPTDEVTESASEGGGEARFVHTPTGEPVVPVVTKMSKRYKNVVNPDDVIRELGADAFRLYEMYMGPLDASKPWNTRDAVGMFRFLQRAWRLSVDESTGAIRTVPAPDPEVERQLHKTVAKVEADVPRLALNTAIAAMIGFVNAATAAGGLTRDQLRRFTLVLAPFAPHMAEELWHKLGHDRSLSHEPFPVADPALVVDSTVEIPVQIGGKIRAKVVVALDADAPTIEAAAMAHDDVRRFLEGKTIKKVIVVPKKMVNIVTG